MSPARFTLLVATVVVGLSAGFFFAYEASVTRGLAEVDDTTYVETFQAINDTIRNSAFAIVFFGSVPAIVVAIFTNRRSMERTPSLLLAAALPLYLTGVVVTAAGNLPLNDDLGAIRDPTPTRAAASRADFEEDWNRFNLLRTIAIGGGFCCLAAAALTQHPRSDPFEPPTI